MARGVAAACSVPTKGRVPASFDEHSPLGHRELRVVDEGPHEVLDCVGAWMVVGIEDHDDGSISDHVLRWRHGEQVAAQGNAR
jgi:hypothetical protein